MKKLLRFSALLTAALMVFIMVGCGGGDEEEAGDKIAPTVSKVDPDGGTLAANGSITVTFSEKMKEVTAAGFGATLSADGKTATLKPSADLAVGKVTVKINGSDMAGNKLAEKVVEYTVAAADKEAPTISDAECDPKNGASGVDPGKYSKIVIVFSESMADIKLDSFEPADAKTEAKFDGTKTLTISFLGGYKLSNEVIVKVTVAGKDKAGNDLAKKDYTFATMKKEG